MCLKYLKDVVSVGANVSACVPMSYQNLSQVLSLWGSRALRQTFAGPNDTSNMNVNSNIRLSSATSSSSSMGWAVQPELIQINGIQQLWTVQAHPTC